MKVNGPTPKPEIHGDVSDSKLVPVPSSQNLGPLEQTPNSNSKNTDSKPKNILKTIASPILFSVAILGKAIGGVKKFVTEKLALNTKSQGANLAISLNTSIQRLFGKTNKNEKHMKDNLATYYSDADFDEATDEAKRKETER